MNKNVAGLLAILLGGLGIHKFYLGKGLTGVLYLIFCWTCIPGILGLVEGFQLLTMSVYDFNKKYGIEQNIIIPNNKEQQSQEHQEKILNENNDEGEVITKVCSKCGTINSIENKFCESCGNKFN